LVATLLVAGAAFQCLCAADISCIAALNEMLGATEQRLLIWHLQFSDCQHCGLKITGPGLVHAGSLMVL
jgi:hypothetical protein